MQTQRLGRISVDKVLEMESGLPLPMMFPDVTSADLARMSAWYADSDIGDSPETSLGTLSMHSFVLRLDGLNVLVDGCCGNHKNRSVPNVHQLNTPWLANLAAVGLKPEDIHMVMCTHLHFDHVGWNTRLENGRWVPTFPNARYVFARQDYEHWSTQEHEAPHREAFDDSVLPVVAAGQADILDISGNVAVAQEVGEGIWLEPAFGHSPGSCLVRARAGGEEALFWGDVIHHPVQLVRPDLPLVFDHDPQAAVSVRHRVLAQAAGSDVTCFPAHFRGSSAGHVHREGDAFRFAFVD